MVGKSGRPRRVSTYGVRVVSRRTVIEWTSIASRRASLASTERGPASAVLATSTSKVSSYSREVVDTSEMTYGARDVEDVMASRLA